MSFFSTLGHLFGGGTNGGSGAKKVGAGASIFEHAQTQPGQPAFNPNAPTSSPGFGQFAGQFWKNSPWWYKAGIGVIGGLGGAEALGLIGGDGAAAAGADAGASGGAGATGDILGTGVPASDVGIGGMGGNGILNFLQNSIGSGGGSSQNTQKYAPGLQNPQMPDLMSYMKTVQQQPNPFAQFSPLTYLK